MFVYYNENDFQIKNNFWEQLHKPLFIKTRMIWKEGVKGFTGILGGVGETKREWKWVGETLTVVPLNGNLQLEYIVYIFVNSMQTVHIVALHVC